MRIGVGKKIGGVYVGTSVSGKEAKGCLTTIGMPFMWLLFWWYLIPKKVYDITKKQMATDPQNVWFKQSWGIVLTLVIFFPAGIYLMFKYGTWNKTIKYGVCAAFALMLVLGIIFGEPVEVDDASDETLVEDVYTQPTATQSYTAQDLMLVFEDDEAGEALIGEIIEVTGELKYDPDTDELTLKTSSSNLDGFVYCEMSEYSDDFSELQEGDTVVIIGTIDKEFAHIYMVECWFIETIATT